MTRTPMLYIGEPSPELVRALLVISDALHPELDRLVKPGKSKESCVLASLATRDFLWRAGFKDARMTTVYLMLRAYDVDGTELHSIGVGDHAKVGDRNPPAENEDRWNGHVVVEVPSAGYIIDTTLWPFLRKQWQDLPGMLAAPIDRQPEMAFGLDQLAGFTLQNDEAGTNLMCCWLSQENERWRDAPDALDRNRRALAVKAMVRRWVQTPAPVAQHAASAQPSSA